MIFHTKKVQYTMQSSHTWYALLLCRIEGLLIKSNDSPSQSVSVWKFPAKFTFHKLTESILMKIALEKQKILSSFYAMCSYFKYWHIYLQKHQNVHLTCLLTSPTCLFPKPSIDIKWIVIGLLNIATLSRVIACRISGKCLTRGKEDEIYFASLRLQIYIIFVNYAWNENT